MNQLECNFVPIAEAPVALKDLPPLRKARAMALLAGLTLVFPICFRAITHPDLDLDNAIEDLLVAGLIDVGVYGDHVSIRLQGSGDASATSQEVVP